MDFCLTGNEAVLLDQVACKLGETITIAVTAKDWAKDGSEPGTADRGRATRPVLQADLHPEAQVQAKQMEVGIVSGDQ